MTLSSLSGAELLKKLLMGGGVTAGAVFAYELLEIAKTQPGLMQTIASWGPLFAIALVGLLLIDRNFGQMIQLGRDNVLAQQKMADAMREIADKDNRQAEKLETLTSYSALQSEKVLKRLEEIGGAVSESAAVTSKTALQLQRHEFWLAQISEVVKSKTGIAVAIPETEAKAKGATA